MRTLDTGRAKPHEQGRVYCAQAYNIPNVRVCLCMCICVCVGMWPVTRRNAHAHAHTHAQAHAHAHTIFIQTFTLVKLRNLFKYGRPLQTTMTVHLQMYCMYVCMYVCHK